MKKTILCALACLLTLCALGVTAGAAEPSAVLPFGAVWALALAALWRLYRAWLVLEKPFAHKRLWALSLVFAGVMTLGQSFSALGTAEWVTGHKLAALCYLLGRVPLYYALMRMLVNALSLERTQAAKLIPGWKIGAALLICWLPWYVCLFPGTVSNDSVSQLMSILGLKELTNANPICQTGLVALFRWMGLTIANSPDLGVALYCLVQGVLMAWLMGALIAEMEKSLAPRWLVWGSFAFYAFCPIFPVFAFCIGKDTNFAMAVLFLALETWRTTHGQHGWKRIACTSIAAVGCVLLRNPGVYLAILTLALTLLWAIRKAKLRTAPLCGLLSAALVFAVLHLAVLPMFDIAPMPETEEYSIPLQQIARVAAGEALTPEQREIVDGVIPVDELKGAYNGELSDPVKDLWRAGVTPEQKAAFWKVWPQIIKDNPMTCMSATFHNTYGYLYPGYVSIIKPTLLIGDQATRTASVKGYYDYSVNPLSVKLKAFTEKLNENALYRILVSPGLYGWITLLSAAWLMRKSTKRELLSAVPALFTLAGCMLSAVNGYFRYAMPLYLSAPLLLWLMAQKGMRHEE